MTKKTVIISYLAILSIPLAYGSFYSVFKLLLQDFPVFWLCLIRMLIAFIFLLPFLLIGRKYRKLSRSYVIPSFILGLVFFIGLVAQSFSLKTVSAGTAGFVAVSFVVITPFFAWWILKAVPRKMILISILLVVFGYFIMFYDFSGREFTFGLGELLNFVGALVIALQIVLFEKYGRKFDTILITITQFFWVNIFMLITVLITNEWAINSPLSVKNVSLMVYLGIFTTVLPFLLQFWGQKHISSVSTSIIISFEPIFATVFGAILLNEQITGNFYWGALLIFIGVIFSVVITNYGSNKSLKEKNGKKQSERMPKE